jgi:hypothetical protein
MFIQLFIHYSLLNIFMRFVKIVPESTVGIP